MPAPKLMSAADARSLGAHLKRRRARSRAGCRPSEAAVAPVLLDSHGAAALYSVPAPQFRRMTRATWWPVQPVQLSARCLRWPLAELQAAVAAMPRRKPEPADRPAKKGRP